MPEAKTKHNKKEFQEFLLAGIEAKMKMRPKRIRIRHTDGNITGLELVWESPKATREQTEATQKAMDEFARIMDMLGL